MQLMFMDEIHALLVLGFLPKSWETLSIFSKNSTPSVKLTIALVRSDLIGKVVRNESKHISISLKSEALVTQNQGITRNVKKNNHERYLSKSWDSRKAHHTILVERLGIKSTRISS